MATQSVETLYENPPPVVIITGEGNEQNLCAIPFLQYGGMEFHNGCFNQGASITQAALSSDARLAELMRVAPDESVFVLADADCIPAIANAYPDPEWLTVCTDRGHTVVLTTVRGREHNLMRTATMRAGTLHVLVEKAGYDQLGASVTWSWGSMGERLPRLKIPIANEDLEEWAKLINETYQAPSRPKNELITTTQRTVAVPVDYTSAVLSTSTPMPKHPENSFLLTRTVKLDQHMQVKATEIIAFPWLESVNKTADEEIAIYVAHWACEQWGIPLTDLVLNCQSTYPDGQAKYDGKPVNVEVTKVQPRWPSGAALSAFIDARRAGKAVNPDKVPVIQCHKCGNQPVPEITDVHNPPHHDESHVWTCTYPSNMISDDWPEHLTVLPEIHIDDKHFLRGVVEAADDKSEKAKRYGAGSQNWLIMLVQGFPPIQEWYEQLRHVDWQAMDAVIAIISEEFGSAIHAYYPLDQRRIVLVKCPKQNRHPCYHPGLIMTLHKGSKEFASLLELGPDRGITRLITAEDGTPLAEIEESPPQPITR